MLPKKMLPKDVFLKYFYYNSESGDFIWKKGSVIRHGVIARGDEKAGASCDGYVILNFKHEGKKYRYKAHRVAFFLETGLEPLIIDHINCIRHDNRIKNLRAADYTLNAMNQSLRKDNKTTVKGVNWHKKSSKWAAQKQINKKKYWIGVFDKMEDALIALEAFCLTSDPVSKI